jgi:membrane fusion protein, heavy metal efflux system
VKLALTQGHQFSEIRIMKYSAMRALCLCLALAGPGLPGWVLAAGDADHEEEGALTMTPAERRVQGIETVQVGLRALNDVVTAPGEVRMNAYRSTQVTPRISAQIVARHARLGETVERGQRLVTLSSVEVAQAQGDLIEFDREWRRVSGLGREVVSARRFVAAQVARQRAYATVRAYGMTKAQIGALLKQGDASKATGAFDLLSPQAGTIIDDSFIVGELAVAGRVLFEISDESVLWIEAQLPPNDAVGIQEGAIASVSIDGNKWIEGHVVQHFHRLDETTRTQSVRIEVANTDDLLHPGQFVQVVLQTGDAAPVVAIEKEAVLLMLGSPTVFKVEGDELHPQPVETGHTRAGFTEIRAGLAVGDEIVVKGAFLLKSLMLKSQMGEGH